MSDLLDQLRRYGEAVEAEAMRSADRDDVIGLTRWRRPASAMLVAAVVVALLALGGLALQSMRSDDRAKVVVGGPTTTETSAAATAVTAPPSTAPAGFVAVRGTANWTGGGDPRGTLLVAACPVDEAAPGCPGWRLVDVAAGGAFELLLPTGATPRDWNVVALVTIFENRQCVFNCAWRTVQVGPSTTVSDAATSGSLRLTVAARVVDVFVRDRNNRPFEGGGVMVTDIRCTEPPCPPDQTRMYSQALSSAGMARIVVDPELTYELFAIAMNTGWPNPQFTRTDGSTSWHSPTLRDKGSDIPEGRTFLVAGAPE